MPESLPTLTELFSNIANAIRAKTGDSNDIVAANFPTAIAAIPTSGGLSNVDYYSGTVFYDSETEIASFVVNTTRTAAPIFGIICIYYSGQIYIVQEGSSNAYHPSTAAWDVGNVTVVQSGSTNKTYTYSLVDSASGYGQMEGTNYDAYFIYQ